VMSGYLLHQGATVQCMHGGQAQPTTTSQKVKVGGQPIVVQSASYTIAGCSYPPPTAANGPCATAQWTSAATRVTSGGAPVLLKDSKAVCVPTGTGLNILSTQTRVKGS
jgi:hypothetical protein